MGALRKIVSSKTGKVSWQIDYLEPPDENGNRNRVRKTFKKEKTAAAELAKRDSLIAEHRYLDVKKDYTTTFGELVEKYKANFEHQPSYQNAKGAYVENFKDYFGKTTLLANIGYVDLETYRNHLRGKKTRSGTERKPASINREMSCLHHLFDKAVQWDLIDKSPFDGGKSLILKENNKRLRFLTESEIQSLLDNCVPHLRKIVICALNTGMRRGEILTLKWSQIRNGFIYLQKTKTNEARQIPINADLDSLFNQIKAEQNPKGKNVIPLDKNAEIGVQCNTEHVFTYNREPIKEIKTAFSHAVDKAKINDFRFHDLRHTFASLVLMKGGSLKDAQELLGHKDITMTLRYSHLTQEHKRKAVNLLNGLTAFGSKNSMSENVRFSESDEIRESANA
jgi:integrase